MGGDVSAWANDDRRAFERAASRVLNAEIRVTSVDAASVLVRFVAYAYKGVYTDELSVVAKLRDATIVRTLKEALAQETGFVVESDPRVTKITVVARSDAGELVGRVTFASTNAIIGGVLGGFFGIVLLGSLLAVSIVCYRRRQAAVKGRAPLSASGPQASVVADGRA